MSHDRDHDWSRGSELRRFERNRFFHGKLLTARDMQAEQKYHAGRLNTHSQHVVGTGIVSGLAVRDVVDSGDGIEITLEPGFALDGAGRAIVVDSTATVNLSSPAEDVFHLYLAHKEAGKDRVPIPEAERTTETDYTYNRTLETFEIYTDPDPPDRPKSVPDIDFPGGRELADVEYGPIELAQVYHERGGEEASPGGDADVYLGAFTRDSGDWVEADTAVPRPHVYTNDMLYAVLVRHVADFENPHQVSVEGVSDEIIERVEQLESVEEFTDRLEDIEERLDRVESERVTLERYVMSESLESTINAFQHVAREFRSGTAEGIVERTRREVRSGATEDREAYLEFIQSTLRRANALVHELDGAATSESLDRYKNAVSDLQQAVRDVSDDRSVSDVAMAQRTVCNAASELKRR